MMPFLSKFILATMTLIAITNFAAAASSVDTMDTLNKAKKITVSPNANAATTSGLNKYPLILDNSHFDIKELLNPKIQESKLSQTLGPGSGGGGNICGANIQRVTADIIRYFEAMPAEKLEVFKNVKLSALNAKFLEGKDLMLRGQRVNAINYPSDQTIVMDPHACALLEQNNVTAKTLLLHEFLGLARIEDTNYQISGEMAKKITQLISSQSSAKNYLILADNIVGHRALAWGLKDSNLDVQRFLSGDYDYKEWTYGESCQLYIVDLNKNEIESLVDDDMDICFGNGNFSVAIYGDNNNGLLVKSTLRWWSILMAVYMIDKSDNLIKMDDHFVGNLQKALIKETIRLASPKYRPFLTRFNSNAFDDFTATGKDGSFNLTITMGSRTSINSSMDYTLETKVQLQLDQQSYPAKLFEITKSKKISEKLSK